MTQEKLICVPKDTLLVNALSLGIAVQMLLKYQGLSLQACQAMIVAMAENQMNSLSKNKLDEMLKMLAKVHQENVDE